MADGGGPGQLSVVLFYKYCGIGASADAVHAWQSALCTRLGLLGRVLVSPQSAGLNGTLALAARRKKSDDVIIE